MKTLTIWPWIVKQRFGSNAFSIYSQSKDGQRTSRVDFDKNGGFYPADAHKELRDAIHKATISY